jgi:hypothetical protein
MRPWPVWNPRKTFLEPAAFAPRRLISETNVCHPIDQEQRFGTHVFIWKNDLGIPVRVTHPISGAPLSELSGQGG